MLSLYDGVTNANGLGENHFYLAWGAELRLTYWHPVLIEAEDWSRVFVRGRAHVVAWCRAEIVAFGEVVVEATGEVRVVAHDNVIVKATDGVKVFLFDKAIQLPNPNPYWVD